MIQLIQATVHGGYVEPSTLQELVLVGRAGLGQERPFRPGLLFQK